MSQSPVPLFGRGLGRIRSFLVLGALAVVFSAATAAAQENWPRFRGHNGEGISTLAGMPKTWELSDYAWSIDLPGVGHSSPIVWGDNVFITAGQPDGQRLLFCIDAATGRQRWSEALSLSPSHLHLKNSYASGSPATDGARVYVPFADEDHNVLAAYDFNGDQLWAHDLGQFSSEHGPGVSPIVYDGMVILPNDQKGPSSIIAFDAETGTEVWRAPRKFRRAAYATPMILTEGVPAPRLICLSGAQGVTGIDPETGEQLFESGELPMRVVASPVYGDGVVIATCGAGGRGQFMVAVDPSGRGDVGESHVRFTRRANLPYVPTPIVYEGHLYLWNDDGIVCCVSLKDGSDLWRKRVGGNYSASPIVIDGTMYCPSEDGRVAAVDASTEYKFHGFSPLGDSSHSTMAVAGNRVFLRGFSKLMCLEVK